MAEQIIYPEKRVRIGKLIDRGKYGPDVSFYDCGFFKLRNGDIPKRLQDIIGTLVHYRENGEYGDAPQYKELYFLNNGLLTIVETFIVGPEYFPEPPAVVGTVQLKKVVGCDKTTGETINKKILESLKFINMPLF